MNNKSAEEILTALHAVVVSSNSKIGASQRKLGKTAIVECKNARKMPSSILDAIETVIDNKSANKYLFSILLACCIKKLSEPAQDIRIAQDNMQGGYSNRSFDQRYITPFLKRYGYTHCEASGLESGRNFERPLPWDLDYPANPRGEGNREAFLGILNYIEVQKGDAYEVALLLMALDKAKQISSAKTNIPPRENEISKIMRIFQRHFEEGSGQGRSRLPVLALYAIYSRLVVEVGRYDGTQLMPLERHTTADLRSGSIGDIQVNKNGEPFEGVEVKSEKPITAAMIEELSRKFGGRKISRYYMLSTSNPYIRPEDNEGVQKAIRAAQKETGAQIIANGLIKTLWYYLRLLKDPAEVLPFYRTLLESDPDVRPGLKTVWNKIIAEEFPGGRSTG